MSYQAYICKLQNVRPHSNADRIQLATVFGNQVVIGLDNKDDDLGIYFPADGQLSSEFCSNNNLFRHPELNVDKDQSGYFEDNRRIRSQKFRGEESDGFWIPISSLDFLKTDIKLKEGEGFDTISGVKICQKYITQQTKNKLKGQNKMALKKDSFPFFKEHVDTKQLAYSMKDIPKVCHCILTEKLHGTSGRTAHTEIPQKPFLRFFKRPSKWEYVTGTRRVILNLKNDMEEGYYRNNMFRKQIHDMLKNMLHKGETIYYEIVGWVDNEKPVMQRADNKKLKDKKFVKRYGDQTLFIYGCQPGTFDIYVYRITMTGQDGYVVEYSWEQIKKRCSTLGLKVVPELHEFMWIKQHQDERDNVKDLMDKINSYLYLDNALPAPSTLDSGHIMEGVVLRIDRGNDFAAYKHKTFQFKVLEGIIKDAGGEDLEEAS